MASQFSTLPMGMPGDPEPLTFHVSEKSFSEFQKLLKLSKIPPTTWWSRHSDDGRFGVSHQWLSQAKQTWLTEFDWRKHEERINSFPNFNLTINDPEHGPVPLHFAALFSKMEHAMPVIFLHGFPSSFIEFLPMMQILADTYTSETLPYHVIVPSLPDYGLSGGSSQDTEIMLDQAARIMHQLMMDLGFSEGYLAQGGDLGSLLARIMSVNYQECKGLHINMLSAHPAEAVPSSESLSPEDLKQLERTAAWAQTGLAYALEHGTRPSTVGLAISSSPLSLLAWVGEKLVEWADPQEPLPLDTVLAMVSFYWFTDTFPRSLYHSQALKRFIERTPFPISKDKPLGYTLFPHDLVVLPHAWAKQIYPNLVFFKAHALGGHFGRLEQPKAFTEDVEEFVRKVRGSNRHGMVSE